MQPRWLEHLFTNLEATDRGSLTVLVIDPSAGRTPGKPVASWLGNTWLAADDWWFREECDPDACSPTDLSPLASRVVTMESRRDLTEWLAHGDGLRDLDILLVDDVERPPCDTGQVPRLGIWTVLHGEHGTGLTPVVNGQAATRTRVVRVAPGGIHSTLAESWSATDRRSVRRQRNALGWRAGALLMRAFEHAWSGGGASGDTESSGSSTTSPGRTAETPRLDGAFVSRWLWNLGRDMLTSVRFREQWGLGIAIDASRQAPRFEGSPQRYVLPPPDRFWADPFPVQHQGRTFMFVEELFFAENKGRISVLPFDDTSWSSAECVLEEPYHLSYPSVFAAGGELFMTPESSAVRRVDLYRAVSFPHRWEKVAELLHAEAADPTILEVDGTWWMFVNLPLPGANNDDECHLYWADRLEGPWQPHPLNPIRSDVRGARPAGRLFWRDGRLYRPAQDCSVRYGYATVINEVELLSKTDYREHEVARILPVWRGDIVATHTLNHAGPVTVWDCLFRIPKRRVRAGA